MDSRSSLRSRFVEWLAGHTLWEIARHLVITGIALWAGSVGAARLMHAAVDTAVNLFLVAAGLLGVWGDRSSTYQEGEGSISIERQSEV